MNSLKNNIIKNQFWVFIPARSGSKTIINKNIKKLNGYPLIYYTLKTSKKLKFIKKIVFSSDSKKYHNLAKKYAKIESHYRSSKTSKDKSSDLDVFKEYVYHKLDKHEKLPEFFINLFTQSNDLVYDPFMGSGTTAKVASQMNRNFIGSEISEEYYEVSKKRISHNENVKKFFKWK